MINKVGQNLELDDSVIAIATNRYTKTYIGKYVGLSPSGSPQVSVEYLVNYSGSKRKILTKIHTYPNGLVFKL